MGHYLKKELYELIKKDERIFDFIQEGSLDGLWYWDLENPENEWMNPRFWEVLGYNPDEMPHKASAWQDIINQDDLKRALDNFQKHVADPSHPYDQIVRYTHKNDSTVWVRCRGLAIRDKEGKAMRMLGAHQDITNIKNAEEKLQQEHEKVKKNEEMYRFLTENGTDVIRYQSPTGIFKYISPNIVELTGYTATEYSKFGPLENVFPEDHPILEQIIERFSKGENVLKVEYRIYHKSGESIWVESRIKAVRDENGETTSLLSSTNNITEQKKLQIELAASEEKYKATYNNAPLAFQSLDIDGYILEVNPQWLQILGYAIEEVIGKWFGDFLHPDYVAHFRKNFPIFKAQGYTNDVQFKMKKRNKEFIYVSFEGCIGYNSEGKFKQTYCTFKDITEQKLVEQKLKQSESRYKQLVETASDAIYLMDEYGKIIDANKTATKILKKDKSEIIGNSIDTVDPNYPIGDFIAYWKTVPYGEQHILETTHITSTGDLIPIEISGKKFELEGKTYYYGVARDITERKAVQVEVQKQRDMFEAVINSVPMRIFWKDKNSVYLGCNPNFAKDAGVNSVEDVIGQKDEAFVWAKDAEQYRADDREIMESGKARLQYEEAFIGIDGEEIFWETNKMPLKNNKNEIIGVLATAENITQRKHAENNLKLKQYYLENAQTLGKIGSWDLDVPKDELSWTDESYRIFGIPIGTPLTYDKFLSQVHPEDREYVDKKWKAALRGEEAYDLTHRLLMDDGEIKWVREKADLVFDDSGNWLRGLGFIQDITESKKAEDLILKQIQEYQALNQEYQVVNEELETSNEELKDAFDKVETSERQFKSYINNAPDGVFITNERGRYLEVNPAASRITGYTKEELLQLSIPDLLQKDEVEKGIQHFKEVQEKGFAKGELGFVTKSGENRYWKVAAVKLSETRFLGFVKDITEQKHAERKIKESLNLLNSFINNFPDDAWAKDLEGKMTLANRFVKDNTFGCEDVIGKTAYDFFPQKIAEECWTSEKDVLLNDKSIQIEEQIPQRDGVHSKILSKFPLHNSDGNVIGIGAIAHDITDRKKAEEALKQSEQKFIRYFNSNPSATFVWKIVQNDFELIEVNETAQGITANKAISFIGLKASQIYKDNPVILQKFLECAKTKTIIDYENKYKNQSLGTVNWLRFRFSFVEPDLILLYSDNITDRKEAERKIKEQNEEYEALNEELRQTNEELFATIRREEEINERFNLAIEATSDGLWDWNLISNEIYYSPRWKSILGYEDHELPNDFSVWEKLTDSEDVKKSWNMLNQLINREIDKFDIEFKMQHKEGHWVDIHSRANVFFNNEDKAIRVVGTHTDITQRKNAEKIIRESEEKLQLSDSRYRKAEEIGKVGNWEYNIEKDAFWASDESKRIFGIDMGQGSFTNEEVESCIPERERVHRALIDLIEQEKPYNLEFEIIAHDTAERKTITSIAELIKDKNGKPLSVVGVIQDITIRKEAETKLKENEEKLRLSIDNSPLGICTNDIEGNFISTNAAYEQLVGYTKEELKQMSFYDITHPDYLDKNKELFHAMAANIKPGFHLEKKYIRKDGSTVDVRVYATTVVDANKKPLFGMAFTEDITWQKVAENDLIEAKEKAEEANRLKTEFLHNMSHEIRTPMNGIMGFSNLLCDLDECNDIQKNYTAIIKNSSTQLLRIIDDILEISTLETRQLKVKEEEFDVNQFIMELFAIYDLKSKERHLPLYAQKELPNGFSSIRSDRTKLHKILSNLLDNAFKFTTTGKIDFGYKIENQNIVFFVKDTGIGISSDKQLKVFERFSQESSLTAQAFGGLGLGLSIAKENAELLNGKLTVESEKNKGAAFFVEIPFKPAKETALYRASEADSKREKKDIVHILIAEDEEVNYLYLETILENTDAFSVKLHHAINGEEAVNKCLNDVIDIVLMDIKMPVMNGYLAAEKIKAVKPELPIIAQTAYSTISEKEMALKYGCDDFISKPIKKEELFLMMMKYLNK